MPSDATLYDYKRRTWTAVPYTLTMPGYYYFTVSGVSLAPTYGATYTNNSVTFTVRSHDITDGAGIIRTTGAGDPSASGTLTKATGAGAVTIDFSEFTEPDTLTLTLPAGTQRFCAKHASFTTMTMEIDDANITENVPVVTVGTSWPGQPINRCPASTSNGYHDFEPNGSTTRVVTFVWTGEGTLDVVAYINSAINPSTTITAALSKA